MRRIDHDSVDLNDTGAARFERGDDALRPVPLRLRVGERLVDDRDLRWMDCGLGGKAVAEPAVPVEAEARE